MRGDAVGLGFQFNANGRGAIEVRQGGRLWFVSGVLVVRAQFGWGIGGDLGGQQPAEPTHAAHHADGEGQRRHRRDLRRPADVER